MKLTIALIQFMIICSYLSAQDIIPRPVKIVALNEPGFEVNTTTRILYDNPFIQQADYFASQLEMQCGLHLQTRPLAKINTGGKDFLLVLDSNLITKDEMYLLEVNDKSVTLKAKNIRGIINGMQTILQLFPPGKTTKAVLPAIHITDYPRFSYRGMHLDVVRHFFPLSYVKKYIDYLTFHKFNTFHWHLTDDQGWRIEILSYPKLNSIGSWRDSTLIGHFKDSPARYDRTRYGGFYTREEVKEILSYAAIRGITVIPEIDIPGHSRATITAYPELSTDPKAAWGVAYTWGMYNRQNNVLAPNPATFQFLRTIFHEIADLFPSPYIHLGGDECSKLWWKKSDSTQAFMRRNGLKDEIALQTYFIEQVSKYLQEKNKKVLGWHEIMEGKLDTSTIVMNWSNDEKAIEAASKGFSIIMSPGKPFYFDHYQSKDPKDSLAIHGYNSLESVYRYNPVPNTIISKGLEGKILGGQANVWTEYMEYPTKVDYMIFPRMSAVSESLWTPVEQKDYADFIRRLKSNIIPRYELWNSSWFKDFEKWTADK
ncbi:MAG: beta-N-acetylhexosaminidase [Chitinophagaceae bacterium]